MIMLVLGLIFLVVGVIMLAGGLALTGPSGGGLEAFLGLGITGVVFAVMGFIFTIIGVVMRRNHARQERIRREGAAGTATITDIGETNMTVNDRPVLNLSLQMSVPGHAPYAVQKRLTMPWNALGRLAFGATVPAMVDPADPDEVVIDWVSAPVMGTVTTMSAMPGATTPMSGAQASAAGGEALLQYLRSMGIDITGPMASMIASAAAHQTGPTHAGMPAVAVQGQPVPTQATVQPPPATTLDVRADEAELRRTGLPGRATIRGAEDLGVGAEGKRLVRLELEVHPTGQAGYPLQHVTMVPDASMPRLAPGTSLAVRVDASNPQNLAIDWDGA